MELMIRIVGENLADVDFGERGAGERRSRLFLGIQKGQEVIEMVHATSGSATFTADFAVSPLPEGGTNFLGPYAHGTRTERFCYLTWLDSGGDGSMTMFSRIKLHLSPLRWERVEAAATAGTPIVMRFSLVGKRGGPAAASVPNDAIRWEG